MSRYYERCKILVYHILLDISTHSMIKGAFRAIWMGCGVRSANEATSVGRGRKGQGSERGEEKVRSRVPRPHTTFVNYFFYTHTRAPLFLIKANM